MDSKTFYLKYRPQRLADLDLLEIRERLSNLVKSKKIPHALLFTGPKGTGKTSAGRILAKAVNCVGKRKTRQSAGQDYEPCNKCSVCREITKGIALDLIEVDAASNRGIDDIRALREKIKLRPAKCQFKVYIIDEAHMLTTEAFNALLKTLEEPPAHAIFILCTTAPEKLPETIISRCAHFNFPKAKTAEVINCLKRVVRAEKLQIEKEALTVIAQSVDGSFRDAHKVLEQLALTGKKITLKKAKKLLRQTETLSPKKLLKLMAVKETKAALLEIERVVNIGGDLVVYVHRILDCLRLAMLAKVGLDDVSPLEALQDLDMTQIRFMIELFTKAASELKFSPIPQLPLELAVVEFCSQKQAVTNPQIQQPIEENLSVSEQTDLTEIESKWSEILAGVKPLNHSVEALLRASRPLKIKDKTLILEVFYKFHKERLEADKCRRVVEEVCSQILGKPIRLSCVLGEKKKKTVDPDVVNLANEIFNGKIIS